MRTITMTEFRAEPGERIRDVSRNGEAFLVTKAGKPAAMLVPIRDADVVTVIEREGLGLGEGVAVTNQHIIDKIIRDVDASAPKFWPGQLVRGRGHVGVIDSIYANLDAAISALVIPEGWYEMQEKKPKTSKSGFWYGVVLVEGSVLLGERDLELAP